MRLLEEWHSREGRCDSRAGERCDAEVYLGEREFPHVEYYLMNQIGKLTLSVENISC